MLFVRDHGGGNVLILLLFSTLLYRIVNTDNSNSKNNNGDLVFFEVVRAAVHVDKIARLQNTYSRASKL